MKKFNHSHESFIKACGYLEEDMDELYLEFLGDINSEVIKDEDHFEGGVNLNTGSQFVEVLDNFSKKSERHCRFMAMQFASIVSGRHPIEDFRSNIAQYSAMAKLAKSLES